MASPASAEAPPRGLPLELILLIVESLAPDNPRAILPAKHETTKTLLSLARVCSALYPTAAKLIRRHCMYIDSRARAEAFLQSLACSPPVFMRWTSQPGLGLSDIESLFLAPFPEDEVEDLFDPEAGEFDLPAGNSLFNPPFPRDGEDEGDEDEELGTPADEALGTQLTPASPGQFPEDSEDGGSDTSAEWPILSHIDPHEFMPIPHYVSWSLAGSWAERPSALNNLTIAMTTRRILLSVAPTLRRLVVDMPLRSLYPEDDRKGVRPVLRQGFEALVNLEEVVSIRDELFLTIVDEAPYNDPPIWDARWPKLRRLALYNPSLDFDDELWHALARLPDLEMVVYTRADGLTDLDDEPLNIKRVWLESVATVSGKSIDKVRRYPRPFTFVHLDAGQFRVDWSSLVPGWRELDPSNRIRTLQGVVKCVRGCMVVSPEESNDENPWLLKSDPRDLCQEKVMKLATGGTLWNVAVSNSYDVCCDPALIQ